MKIHIVQKGDTLWEISKKYGVDFEELKGLNSQLSSPDMIMPGMKIKIPGTTKAVKKEAIVIKEKEKPVTQPYKDVPPKPIATIKEDDVKLPKPVKPEMPVPALPQMPIFEQDIKQYTTINFPPMPQMKAPYVKPEKKEIKKEVKKEEVKKPKPVAPPKPIAQPKPIALPKPIAKPKPVAPPKPITQPKPIMKPVQQPIKQPVKPIHQPPVYQPVHHQPMHLHYPPMIPVCCHHFQPPCCPPMPYQHTPFHYGEQMAPAFTMPAQAAPIADCGCNGSQMMPHSQMDPNMFAAPISYPAQQPAFDGMYPPHFDGMQMQDTGSHYPQPPSFPGFSALRKDEKDDNQKE
ncbi:SafA/ExsA family spore coat assembly protein [Oceanobacillus saliphilus]|uniref:SafA/ExsA family spore coat assembly protein n=1 Tax=Oceanobacillus saliphilus TaxID=2925834 RepID=UPI00201E2499|nr:SafA/ExsA family spore coat assembly protein [Oceanobacillus saliphilus]